MSEFSTAIQAVLSSASRFPDAGWLVADVPSYDLWDAYLESFPEEERQPHNCSACRHFIRHYGAIVTPTPDNEVATVWDTLPAHDLYVLAFTVLGELVRRAPIRDAFVSRALSVAGTASSFDLKRNVTWHHLHMPLPYKVRQDHRGRARMIGQRRETAAVFRRSLDELKPTAVASVLELIHQRSLYRGDEAKAALVQFQALQQRYLELRNQKAQSVFVWRESAAASERIARIRNTAIGTLLIDLSTDMPLEQALARYRSVMSPTNYQRSSAPVKVNQIDKARARIEELGLTPALQRTLITQLPVTQVLFSHRPVVKPTDPFDQIKPAPPAKKQLDRTEEITYERFVSDVLPGLTEVKVLVERPLLSHLMTLVGPAQEEGADRLLKWSNGLSWSYRGGLADSIAERVKRAGGQVEGLLRISLSWSNHDDLDLHLLHYDLNTVRATDHVYYGSKVGACGGTLDVDMNVSTPVDDPVENIIFSKKIVPGSYRVQVQQFNKRKQQDQGFEVEIQAGPDQLWHFYHSKNETKEVLNFEVDTDGRINIPWQEASSVQRDGVTRWGVTTGQFYPVRYITWSPNCWGETPIGQQHLMFLLDAVVPDADAEIRPFLNEFLSPDLKDDRKVLEQLGGVLPVERPAGALAGFGFSTTQRAAVTLKVTGQFERLIKVTF